MIIVYCIHLVYIFQSSRNTKKTFHGVTRPINYHPMSPSLPHFSYFSKNSRKFFATQFFPLSCPLIETKTVPWALQGMKNSHSHWSSGATDYSMKDKPITTAVLYLLPFYRKGFFLLTCNFRTIYVHVYTLYVYLFKKYIVS